MNDGKPDTELPSPETLYAAALYLATSYARSGCPMVCGMVMRQLRCIAAHPSAAVPEPLRETCRRLYADWERIGQGRSIAGPGVRDSAADAGASVH